jgi:flagellar capping protein FliD
MFRVAESPFQITGVASGIGWDEIINKMLEQARKPEVQWQSKIDTLSYKKTLYQQLSSQFFTMRNSLTKLKLTSTYKSKIAEFTVASPAGANADSIVKATPTADAEIAQWKIEVKQTAVAQQQYSIKVDDPAAALGMTGAFRIHVGSQTATIDITADDTIRTINNKIYKAADQNGNPLLVTAKLIDNRLVLESAESGLDYTGYKSTETLTMSDAFAVKKASDPSKIEGYYMYLPRAANGTYPEHLFSVAGTDSSGGTLQYIEGQDYIYDSSIGAIEWITADHPGASATVQHRRPGVGTQVTVMYNADLAITRTSTKFTDVVPPLPSGEPFDFAHNSFKVTDSQNRTFTGGFVDLPLSPPTSPGAPTGKISHDPDAYLTAATLPPPDMSGEDDFVVGLNTTSGNTEMIWNYAKFYSVAYQELTAEAGGVAPTDPDVVKQKALYLMPPQGGNYALSITQGSYEADPPVVPPAHPALTDWKETEYGTNTNQFYLEEVDPATGKPAALSDTSLLVKLGFFGKDSGGDYAPQNLTEAKNAIFTLNGIEIQRNTNTIDDVIANVPLELTGIGVVTMNITQDATAAIEGIEAFIEAYNQTMLWITDALSEQYTSSSEETDDYMKNLLSESKGKTIFGLLHGDQLLWSIKNQMRALMSNPVKTMSNGIASRKISLPASPMDLTGSFYITMAGQTARINVERTDSLEAIQRKISSATNITSANGTSASGADMKLIAKVRDDGALSIIADPTASFPSTRSDTIIRNSANTGSYDYLSYTVVEGPPTNGVITVKDGTRTYEEGVDYRISKSEDKNGVIQNRIEWLSGGRDPGEGRSYNVAYTYDATAISIEHIPGSGDLSFLDLHADISSVLLSSYGITTEADDFGKSGLLEFDSDKLFEAIKGDPATVSNVMTTFFREMDTYIGNLVDSTPVLVAGTVVTKGRIANAMSSLDNEVTTLNAQIAKLETQLAQRQNSLYKQYTDMELAIQKLNAQMSSVAQFFANTSGTSSS